MKTLYKKNNTTFVYDHVNKTHTEPTSVDAEYITVGDQFPIKAKQYDLFTIEKILDFRNVSMNSLLQKYFHKAAENFSFEEMVAMTLDIFKEQLKEATNKKLTNQIEFEANFQKCSAAMCRTIAVDKAQLSGVIKNCNKRIYDAQTKMEDLELGFDINTGRRQRIMPDTYPNYTTYHRNLINRNNIKDFDSDRNINSFFSDTIQLKYNPFGNIYGEITSYVPDATKFNFFYAKEVCFELRLNELQQDIYCLLAKDIDRSLLWNPIGKLILKGYEMNEIAWYWDREPEYIAEPYRKVCEAIKSDAVINMLVGNVKRNKAYSINKLRRVYNAESEFYQLEMHELNEATNNTLGPHNHADINVAESKRIQARATYNKIKKRCLPLLLRSQAAYIVKQIIMRTFSSKLIAYSNESIIYKDLTNIDINKLVNLTADVLKINGLNTKIELQPLLPF